MNIKIAIYSFVSLVIVIFILLIISVQAPNNFPKDLIYTINKGTGLNSLSDDLFNKNIIKSPFMFKVLSIIFGGTKGIKAGDYALNYKQNTLVLSYRISQGDFDLIPVKITIPEGLNIYEIRDLISTKFPSLNMEIFLELVKDDEGYLFPDTYLFLPNVSLEEILITLKNNFDDKIRSLDTAITTFGKPLADIIKLASILEEEARTTESRQIVADILWKRLALNIPLQVDASFKYINGKTTVNLTLDDLKIDSLYNSYLYKGLPPTPICNPGLDSINAAITPIKTDYLFFLSDKDGNMHYAKTYNEHLKNKEMYLK